MGRGREVLTAATWTLGTVAAMLSPQPWSIGEAYAAPPVPKAASASVPSGGVADTNARRPNILFILCDDLGYGDMSCFGQKMFSTPNMDRLAADGQRWTQHYSAAPVCVASRSGLLLGSHMGDNPDRDQQFDKPIPDTPTIASVLHAAGYRTMIVGKWGLGGKPQDGFPAHPQKRGFDQYFGIYTHAAGHVHYPDAQHPFFDGYKDITSDVTNDYSTDLYTAKAKQWIVEQATQHPKQPFFMYLAYIAPHSAFNVPDSPYPSGGGLKGGLQIPLTPHPEMKNKWIDPTVANATWDDDNNRATPPVPWNDQMKRYATMVRRLDAAVGDLRQTLEDLHIDKNTLIVLTSDNGPAFDDGLRAKMLHSWGPLDGFKRDVCEGGFREPTVVCWPGVAKAGVVSDRPSVMYDWLPTFADLAGIVPPATTDGLSLAPLLIGNGKSQTHDFMYFEFHGPSNRIEDRSTLKRKGYTLPTPNGKGAAGDPWGQQQAVRIGDFVGLRAQIKSADDPLELYNVAADPHEDHNLAGNAALAPLLARMKTLMITARRPQPGNKKPFDSAPLPAVLGVSADVPGLKWRSFAGTWPWAPDVDFLKLLANGVEETPDPRGPLFKPKAGAVEWTGYLNVPAAGTYVFTLEGGKQADLWIHDARVLDTDADAAAPRRSDSVILAAGLHPIRLLVTQDGSGGEKAVRLLWTPPTPGASPEPIPASAYFHVENRRR